MQRLLRKAAAIAEAKNDWYGILQVLRFEMEYGVGKPVQRSVSATVQVQDMIDAFLDDAPTEESEN